jgi:hypothetical protein
MNKNFVVTVSILMTIFLSACGPSKADLVKYLSETQTAMPTITPNPSPTPIPLSKESVVPVLIQSGDLPAGFSGAQFREEPLFIHGKLPVAKLIISQQFAKGDNDGGGVTVYIYQQSTDVQKTYEVISDGLPDLTDSDLAAGEKSSGESTLVPGLIDSTAFAFIRCSAAVYIQMDGVHNLSAIVPYAKNIDKRLTPLICQ